MATTSQTKSTNALLAEFTARAEPVGTVVQRFADSSAAAASLIHLAREHGAPSISISGEAKGVASDLVAALASAGLTCWTPADANEARDAPFGVSVAQLAVAETGSLMLAEDNLADRAVGLVSIAHVTLCRIDALVPSLAEAARVLREIASRPRGGYTTLVTGPSRTADIEMSLTVGVQGPAKVYALFVDLLS
ncbi:MAG: LutC/YkgG family protein [Thermomicrobiales bacterium]